MRPFLTTKIETHFRKLSNFPYEKFCGSRMTSVDILYYHSIAVTRIKAETFEHTRQPH